MDLRAINNTYSRTEKMTDLTQNGDNLIQGGTFTDQDGNASLEDWTTNTVAEPFRIPGGRHQLALSAGEYLSQKLAITDSGTFKVHYSFQTFSNQPTPSTYIHVNVGNEAISEAVAIVVNNGVLYPRTHTGTRVFSLRDGPLSITFSNEVLNLGRLITLTDIELWIEPLTAL